MNVLDAELGFTNYNFYKDDCNLTYGKLMVVMS